MTACEGRWKRCWHNGPIPECPRVARADGLRAKHKHGVKKEGLKKGIREALSLLS